MRHVPVFLIHIWEPVVWARVNIWKEKQSNTKELMLNNNKAEVEKAIDDSMSTNLLWTRLIYEG